MAEGPSAWRRLQSKLQKGFVVRGNCGIVARGVGFGFVQFRVWDACLFAYLELMFVTHAHTHSL